MKNFSHRNNIRSYKVKGSEYMSDRLRNRLLNLVRNYIRFSSSYQQKIESIWDAFFGLDLDKLTFNFRGDYKFNPISDKFKALAWNRVYDFLEFLYQLLDNQHKQKLENRLNTLFSEELIPYKMSDGLILKRFDENEQIEIEKAIEDSEDKISLHLKKSFRFLSDRENPDFENSAYV